ncbi:hypothetical protein B0H19DRAFT_1068276 [Mycena capillaripes]|nr:hypothetical protein B0H19DRAFT_1068276 [Mycena capillaripes]
MLLNTKYIAICALAVSKASYGLFVPRQNVPIRFLMLSSGSVQTCIHESNDWLIYNFFLSHHQREGKIHILVNGSALLMAIPGGHHQREGEIPRWHIDKGVNFALSLLMATPGGMPAQVTYENLLGLQKLTLLYLWLANNEDIPEDTKEMFDVSPTSDCLLRKLCTKKWDELIANVNFGWGLMASDGIISAPQFTIGTGSYSDGSTTDGDPVRPHSHEQDVPSLRSGVGGNVETQMNRSVAHQQLAVYTVCYWRQHSGKATVLQYGGISTTRNGRDSNDMSNEINLRRLSSNASRPTKRTLKVNHKKREAKSETHPTTVIIQLKPTRYRRFWHAQHRLAGWFGLENKEMACPLRYEGCGGLNSPAYLPIPLRFEGCCDFNLLRRRGNRQQLLSFELGWDPEWVDKPWRKGKDQVKSIGGEIRHVLEWLAPSFVRRSAGLSEGVEGFDSCDQCVALSCDASIDAAESDREQTPPSQSQNGFEIEP